MIMFKTKEELYKEVLEALVANRIYRGVKFLFICRLWEDDALIDAINLDDGECDLDVAYCEDRDWVLCRNREDAYDYAEREWNRLHKVG